MFNIGTFLNGELALRSMPCPFFDFLGIFFSPNTNSIFLSLFPCTHEWRTKAIYIISLHDCSSSFIPDPDISNNNNLI